MAISLQQAIDYSKANPQSDYAAKIGTAIKSGAFDQIAQQQGVDLSPYGRPKATTTEQPAPDQPAPAKTSPVATAASFALDPVSAALKPAAEQVAPAVEKVGTDLTARGQNIVQAAQQSGQTALEAEKNLGEMGVPKPLATVGAVGLAGTKLGGQVAGQIAGGATDILGEGISAVAPQWLKDAVGRLGTQVAQLPQTQQAIKTATDAYNKIPDEVKPNVDALVNTLGLLGGGKAVEAAPGAIEKATPAIKSALAKAPEDMVAQQAAAKSATVEKLKPIVAEWAKPGELNAPGYNKARTILKNNPDTPQFLAETGINPYAHVEDGKYATTDTATSLRDTAGQMSNDTLRPSLQMADYNTPKTSIDELKATALKNINADKELTAGDKETAISNLEREMNALGKKYSDGLSLTDMHDEKITYAGKSGYSPIKDPSADIKASSNRAIASALQKTVETKAPENVPVGDFNKYLSKYYKAADYLDSLQGKKAPVSAATQFVRGAAKFVGAGAAEAVAPGVVSAFAGYQIGKAIEHAVENLTGPMRAQFLNNLEKTNPKAFTALQDYMRSTKEAATTRPALPAPSFIPMGPKTPGESSVTSVAAEKGPVGVSSKSGQFKSTYLSGPKGEGGGPSTQGIPKELQPLAQEAMKYKSAEEFVRAQDIYQHGTSKEAADSILKTGFDVNANPRGFNAGSGISLTKSDKVSNAWATDTKDGTVVYSKLGADVKLVPIQQVMDSVKNDNSLSAFDSAVKRFKAQGYDGIDYRNGFTNKSGKLIKDTEDEIRVWNTDKIKPIASKSQLTDFYNKVKGKK